MRKYTLSSFLQTQYNSNTPTCLKDITPLTQNNECVSSRHDLTEEVSYKFTFCSFSQLCGESDNGGAISCTGSSIQTSTSLLVASCSFSECSAPDGGAIYTSTLSSFELQNSFFFDCSSTYNSSNHGGGSVWISAIQHQLVLCTNEFTSSTCKGSGGGVLIEQCSDTIYGAEIIHGCKFLDCNATDQSPDGGGVCVWNNLKTIGLCCCLFSSCHSAEDGGAIRHDINGYEPNSYPIRFCFFERNAAMYGNDIYFSYALSESPCFHCFSTATEQSICYSTGDYNYNFDDWLPIGDIRYIKDDGVDTDTTQCIDTFDTADSVTSWYISALLQTRAYN